MYVSCIYLSPPACIETHGNPGKITPKPLKQALYCKEMSFKKRRPPPPPPLAVTTTYLRQPFQCGFHYHYHTTLRRRPATLPLPRITITMVIYLTPLCMLVIGTGAVREPPCIDSLFPSLFPQSAQTVALSMRAQTLYVYTCNRRPTNALSLSMSCPLCPVGP